MSKEENHFEKVLLSTCNILKTGAFLFTGIAFDIGIERLFIDAGNVRLTAL